MPEGDIIFERLRQATDAERGRLARVLGIDPSPDREANVFKLSREYRASAGHTLRNLFRKEHELPYRDILLDAVSAAAKHAEWKPPVVKDTAEDEWLEDYIFEAYCFAAAKKNADLSSVEIAKAQESAERLLVADTRSAQTPLAAALVGALGAGAVGQAVGGFATVGVVAAGALPALVIGSTAALVFNPLFLPSSTKVLNATLGLIAVRKRREFEAELSQLEVAS